MTTYFIDEKREISKNIKGYFMCVRENEREELWFQIVVGENH